MKLNRRTFMGAGLSAGLLAAGRLNVYASINLENQNLSKADLPTPALILDLDAFESNLKTMADHCRRSGCNFRPHAKTHKCPEIAKRQIAAGAVGVCGATVPEVEAMVKAGVTGVLLTSPIVEQHKIERVVNLSIEARNNVKSESDIGLMISLGEEHQLKLVAQAAAAAGAVVDVMIDLDVGDGRTGAPAGEPALQLAHKIKQIKQLRLRGLQAYSGRSAHIVGFERRKQGSTEAMNRAAATRKLLEQAGFDVPILSGGSTGTYNIDSEINGISELQVGSFIFMDLDYRRIGGKDGNKEYKDFKQSLTVLSTVICSTRPGRVTIDGGNKSFATDVRQIPEAVGRPDIELDRAGDEFAVLTSKDGNLPKLGDRLEFVVPHCDPTVNLYDQMFVCRGDRVVESWPITARKSP